MRSAMILALFACGAASTVPPVHAAPADAPVEWIVEDGNVLTLRLVLDDKKPCGGELTVDPNRRVVRFEGVPGDIGCRQPAEGPFEAVRAVRTQRREAGFVLEIGHDKTTRLVLLPLPHYRWFAQQWKVRQGALEQQFSSLGVTDRDGESLRMGGSSATASVEKVDIPSEVVADTQKAVDLIREAMGRVPSPAVAVREVLQGRPVDVTLQELLDEPGSFASQPIRLRARLERAAVAGGYRLVDEGASLSIAPDPQLEAQLQAAGQWLGQEVEVTGRLRRQAPPAGAVAPERKDEYFVSAWDCLGPEAAHAAEGQPVTLEALVTNPAAYEGELVRVVGKFRGRNLAGDLPARSHRRSGDWVIKSDRYAIWVTGHKASGEGFTLDPDMPGTNAWLEVVGRSTARRGVTYVEATRVALTTPPPGARVRPPRQLVANSQATPVVVFCLPLEGETVAADGRIVVQFAKNMDDESFKGRVRLRYPPAGGRESLELPTRLSYDETRRSLVVDPVPRLEPGRKLELALLAGIVDLDGMPLAPRRPVEGAVDLLSYVVASN